MRFLFYSFFALAASVPLAGASGYLLGHFTRHTQVDGLITKHATRGAVQNLFHLGTDGTGRAMYTQMVCAGHVCAWDYRGATWRVTLQLVEPHAAPPTYPSLGEVRQ